MKLRRTYYTEFGKRSHLRLLQRAMTIGISTIQPQVHEKCERLIVGYSTNNHLLLDFDRAKCFLRANLLTKMVQRDYPFVGHALMVQSSIGKYHVVFDDIISWSKITHVTQTLACLGVLNRDYMKIRKFREDLTLRISSVDRGFKQSLAPVPVGFVLLSNASEELQRACKTLTYAEVSKLFQGIDFYLSALSAYRNFSGLPSRLLSP